MKEELYMPMPAEVRVAFERFVLNPPLTIPKQEIILMLDYISKHGIMNVYNKVQLFMPRHRQILRGAASILCEKAKRTDR